MFLPTKVAASTIVLSKRWEFIWMWMWLPRLDYHLSHYSERERLRSFINLNLPQHKAPIIESLRLKFDISITQEDIIMWVLIAVFRCVRELILDLSDYPDPDCGFKLPSCLYTCKSLVVLKLTLGVLVDVPLRANLPSLKTLFLQRVKYSNKESLHRLLSSCSVLEDLVFEPDEYDHNRTHSIIVPSLQRLNIRMPRGFHLDRILINTPSLKCFKVMEYKAEDNNVYSDTEIDIDSYSLECYDMPKLEEAEIESSYPDIDKFVKLITSVKRLSLCIPVDAEEALYGEGIVFNKFQHLKLCSSISNWPKLLVRLLKDSPNLRELEVYVSKGHVSVNPVLCLDSQLNPECLFASLETFKWTGIYGTQQEMDLTKYILRNACCLKIATILFPTPNELEEEYKLEMMIQELSLSFRGMDRISGLPDELLVKVLLFLPTKEAVRTNVLSKRWEFVWRWLPKLEYGYSNSSECKRLRSFINLNLAVHKAPVIESLCLKFNEGCSGTIKPKDIILWVTIVVFRCVRELTLNLFNSADFPNCTKLPNRLYTCKSLVVLKLVDEILVDVPRMAYLPSLKTLVLQCVTYSDEKSLPQLLSSCPVLEDLFVERGEYNEFQPISIIVPSLQRLTLRICRGDYFDTLLINTPSLKCFQVKDYRSEGDIDRDDDDGDNYSLECNDMPKLEEADIDSSYPDLDKFVRAIKYVKRLSLCISINAEDPLYRESIVFNKLQHLKLCSCVSNWPKLLFRLLKYSPNLREVEVYTFEGHGYVNPVLCLENQVLNPERLFSSLETFKWNGIYGTQQEMDFTKYILRNACCLKIATILFQTPNELEEEYKLEMMIQELSLSFRGSKTCQLVFD